MAETRKGDAVALVNFPYRWLWSTWHKNLFHAWRDIGGGLRNLRAWLPVIWEDRWYDADYALRLLEVKLRQMADHFERYGTTVGNERDIKNMRTCAALCRRMQEDSYGFDENSRLRTYFKGNRTWIYGKRRDAAYLGRLLGKHLPFWWD